MVMDESNQVSRLQVKLDGATMRLRVPSAIMFSLLATFFAASNTKSQVALTHVTVIDVRNGSTKADMRVLIFGNRITAVGSSQDTALSKQVHLVDGRGKFLILGLWDMHVHTDGDGRAPLMLLA